MQCRLRDRRSRLFSLGLRPCPLRTEIPPDSLNLLIMLCTVEGEISKSLPIFLWGTLFLNISIIFSRICWQTGDPRPIFAPKGLDLSWMLLLYQIIITITCWHQLFQITSLFNQFTSLLALNCSCPNFFWNVLQVWMTGKDVYLQMTWSWPDKTWNILCSYCLQWNTSQSKFRNHYFLFLFAFSILSQLFLIWGCTLYTYTYMFNIVHKHFFKFHSTHSPEKNWALKPFLETVLSDLNSMRMLLYWEVMASGFSAPQNFPCSLESADRPLLTSTKSYLHTCTAESTPVNIYKDLSTTAGQQHLSYPKTQHMMLF